MAVVEVKMTVTDFALLPGEEDSVSRFFCFSQIELTVVLSHSFDSDFQLSLSLLIPDELDNG